MSFLHREKLQKYLCKNKSKKLLPNSNPDIYQLDCTYGGKYIDEKRREKNSLQVQLNIQKHVMAVLIGYNQKHYLEAAAIERRKLERL